MVFFIFSKITTAKVKPKVKPNNFFYAIEKQPFSVNRSMLTWCVNGKVRRANFLPTYEVSTAK